MIIVLGILCMLGCLFIGEAGCHLDHETKAWKSIVGGAIFLALHFAASLGFAYGAFVCFGGEL